MENKENNYVKEVITDLDKLSERSDEIDIKKDNNLMRGIILELKSTLREVGGVGLAAPQIGYFKRIFIINFNGDMRTFINPIITSATGLGINREACLSVPGKEFLRIRNNSITVAYQTPLGKIESKKLVGMAAYVFQHELDHLDGMTLMDIGLEVDDIFDNATEEEKNQVISAYMESLDIRQKELEKEVEEDPELKKISDGIKFMEKIQKGEIELGDAVTEVIKASEKSTDKNE